MIDNDDNGFDGPPPSMLLPYIDWIEDAYRQVMIKAFKYVIKEGMPTGHSFYITYQTNYPGVDIPARVKAKYPETITIVLEHQFWDLTVNDITKEISVGLSFGGVACKLVIPFGCIVAFNDPAAQIALTFQPIPPTISNVETTPFIIQSVTAQTNKHDDHQEASDQKEETTETKTEESQVISLDAFRKKHD